MHVFKFYRQRNKTKAHTGLSKQYGTNNGSFGSLNGHLL